MSTNDGGSSWQALAALPISEATAIPSGKDPAARRPAKSVKPTLPRLNVVKFFDRDHGVIVGGPTAEHPSGILATSDGGKTFRDLTGPVAGHWQAASFAQQGKGIAVGLRGSSALLGDEQILPTRLNNLDPRGIFGVRLQSAGPAWLVGDGGLVLQSTNQGLLWQAPPGDLPEGARKVFDFRAVAARGDNVWVAGEPGSVVWHSADAGHTWDRGVTHQTLPLRALSFVSDSHGFAVGALGTILRTEDGGKSWRGCRGQRRRLALLSLLNRSSEAPLSLLSLLSGELGYRTAVLQVAREDMGSPAGVGLDRQELLHLATIFAGGNRAHTSWQFPLSVPGLDRDSVKLLADWNRRTEGKLSELLIGHLTMQLRMWRPSVLLLDEPTVGDALARTIEQAALHAVEQAADKYKYPEQLQTGGLAAWQVLKVFNRLPPGSNGPVRLDAFQFLPHMGSTVQVTSAPARAMLLDDTRVAPQQETYRLQENHLANLREDLAGRDFFTGLNLPPASSARRELCPLSEQETDKQIALARLQRTMNAYLARFLNDPRMSNQVIAQLPTLIRDMPPAQAALQLQQTADAYLASGKVDLAEQTLIELTERYPDEPAAAQAMIWLIQSWGSLEMTWQKVRREQIGKVAATPNPEAGARRIALSRERIRRQMERQPNALPGVPDPNQQPELNGNEKPEIVPAEFRENARRGRLDPGPQFEGWLNRSQELAGKLESRIPGIHRQPQVQFPLASLARKTGNSAKSDEIFRRFLPPEGVESLCPAARELWLTNPVTVARQQPAVCSTASPSQLDGVLDDACWQNAAEIVLATGPNVRTDGERHPFVMVCYDAEHLYLAGSFPRAAGTRLDRKISRARRHDEDLKEFDRLRILLDVDRDYYTWYDMQVDQRGCTADSCWRDSTWNPKWYVATDGDEDRWRIEIAIPFAELAWRPPTKGTTWGLALIRTIPAVSVETWVQSSSSEPQPESFGLLRFD
jgi:hypothetical protein